MSLVDKQAKFAQMVAELLFFADHRGYQVTLGEAYRTPEQAEIYAKQGKGIKNSLHCQRLAIDLNLFKDGKYLTNSADYAELGAFWRSLGGRWGGDFNDGNHFEYSG